MTKRDVRYVRVWLVQALALMTLTAPLLSQGGIRTPFTGGHGLPNKCPVPMTGPGTGAPRGSKLRGPTTPRGPRKPETPDRPRGRPATTPRGTPTGATTGSVTLTGEVTTGFFSYSPAQIDGGSMGLGLVYRSDQPGSNVNVGEEGETLTGWHLGVLDGVEVLFQGEKGDLDGATPGDLTWLAGSGDLVGPVEPPAGGGGGDSAPTATEIWFTIPNHVGDRFRLVYPTGSDASWRLERYTRTGHVMVYERYSQPWANGWFTTYWRPSVYYDPHDNRSTYAYDFLGRLSTITDVRGVVVTFSWGGTSCAVSYSKGTTAYPQHNWSFSWDAATQRITQITYPNTTYVTLPSSSTSPLMDLANPVTNVPLRYKFSYHASGAGVGLLHKVRNARLPGFTETSGGDVLVNTYANTAGKVRVTQQVDRYNRTHTYSYSLVGAGGNDVQMVYTKPETTSANTVQTMVVDPDGNMTKYTITAGTKPRGTEPSSLTWEYQYNSCSCGNPTQIKYPSGLIETMLYDSIGYITSWTGQNPAGSGTVTYYWSHHGFDRGGRPISYTPPSGAASLVWTYTWVTRADGLFGQKPTFIREDTSAINLEGGGMHVLTDQMTLGTDGRIQSVVDAGGQVYVYSYYLPTHSTGNLLLRKVSRSPVRGDLAHETVIEYSGIGQISKILEGPAGSQTATTYVPDSWDRLTKATTSPIDGGVPYDSEYYRDRYNNIAVVRRTNIDKDGNAPKYDDGSGGGRAFVRNEWHYFFRRLDKSYIDRRSLADGNDINSPTTGANPWMVEYVYTYKPNLDMLDVTLPNGSKTSFVTDGYGMLFKTTGDVGGLDVELGRKHYNMDLQLEKEEKLIDMNGSTPVYATTTYTRNHGGYGWVTGITSPDGNQVDIEYDQWGRVIEGRVLSAAGDVRVVTDVVLDELGRKRQLRTNNVGTADWSTTRYRYNKRSQVEWEEDPMGRRTYRSYDSYGRLTKIRDNLNVDPTKSNELELRYQPGRDWVQTMIVRIFEESNSATPPAGTRQNYLVSFEHDLLGRMTKKTRLGLSGGSQSAEISTYAYDSFSNLTTFKGPDQQGNADLYSRTVFDAEGRWVEFVKRTGPNASTDRIRLTSSYTDKQTGSNNVLVERVDGKGFKTTSEYDALYRLIDVFRPGYDTAVSTRRHRTTLTYDEGSRVDTITDGNNTVFNHTYDPVGRLLTRIATINSTDVSSTVDREIFTYDDVGRLEGQGTYLGATLAGGSTLSRDTLGRITKEAFRYFGIDQTAPVEITSGYSYSGQSGSIGDSTFRRSLGYSSGFSIGTTPDSVGRLKDIHVTLPGSADTWHLSRYRYSGGQINQRTQNFGDGSVNSITSDLLFDGHRRLSTLRESLNGIVAHQEDYTYDSVGNITQHQRDATGGDIYQYDEYHRMIGAKYGVPVAQMGNYGSATSAREVAYVLDNGNNRESVTTTLSGGASTTDIYTTESNSPRYASQTSNPLGFAYDGEGNLIWDGRYLMKYDFKNRLSEIYEYDGSDAESSSSSPTLDQLRDAQQTIEKRAKGDLRSFARDFPRKLKAPVRLSSNETAQLTLIAVYSYDTYNRRIYRLVPATNTDQRFAYDGWQEVEELVPDMSGPTTTAKAEKAFVWGVDPDALVGYYRLEGTTWRDYYPVQNVKGSVIALYDNAGALAESVEYDAYGAATFTVGGGTQGISSKGNPYAFQGRRLDSETGFVYFRNRYLHTGIGRFLTNDPLGIWADDTNLGNGLVFIGNNPSSGRDPSGLLSLVGGFGGGLGLAGAGASPPGMGTAPPTHTTAAPCPCGPGGWLIKLAAKFGIKKVIKEFIENTIKKTLKNLVKNKIKKLDKYMDKIDGLTDLLDGDWIDFTVELIPWLGDAKAGKRIYDAYAKIEKKLDKLKDAAARVAKRTKKLVRHLEEHRKKLKKYKADPWSCDSDGRLARNKGFPDRIKSIISGRIKHLEDEIRAAEKNIGDILDEEFGPILGK